MRKKTTLQLDADLLRAAKMAAARSGKHEYQIVEEALRRYLGLELLSAVHAQSDLNGDEALRLAYQELHASRE
jgi:hypothetical protein